MAKTSAKKRVAIYARVSTDEQTVDNQLEELQAVAERHGWEIFNVYTDPGTSGHKRLFDRSGGKELRAAIMRKEFDALAVWSVDRLGRSLQDLLEVLTTVHEKGIDLYLHKQGIDTTTASGRMMFQLLGVFAEFERSMIQERVKAGLQRARSQGKQLGRPKLSEDTRAAILEARAAGDSMHKIARQMAISVGTVSNVLREKTG